MYFRWVKFIWQKEPHKKFLLSKAAVKNFANLTGKTTTSESLLAKLQADNLQLCLKRDRSTDFSLINSRNYPRIETLFTNHLWANASNFSILTHRFNHIGEDKCLFRTLPNMMKRFSKKVNGWKLIGVFASALHYKYLIYY